MSGWQEILDRVLDGGPVSSDEAAALQVALSDESNCEQAREWMQFDAAIVDHSLNDDAMVVSRDRLWARVILREKHIELTNESNDAMYDGLPNGSCGDRRTRKTIVQTGPATRETPGSTVRQLWMPAIVVLAIVMIVAGTFWVDPSSNSYAAPRAQGDYRVLGDPDPNERDQIERGDRIVSGGHGAQMELGSYCRLTLDAHTDVTVHGAPHREVVELHQGHVAARITPDHGRFVMRTPLGPVIVKGTEFETTVEYPNGMPGDLSMNRAKKVVVTVAVVSGAVLCQLGDGSVLLESGASRVFADEVKNQKTSGEVTALTDTTVTVKVKSGESSTFHVGENKLTRHEAGQLVKGDKVTVAWVEDGGRRWIRDIDGEGVLEGSISSLGDAWIEVQTGKRKVKLRAPWRGGNPADGGGPDRAVMKKLGTFRVGDEVAVTWAIPEGKRVIDVRLRKPGARRGEVDLTKAPPELYGLSGRVIGRLVSKDVEEGELTLKIVKVDKVWRNNKARNPKSAEGRTLKIDGVFGKFLDVLLTLKENDGVQIEVKHVRGDGLTFLGEELKRVEIEEEKPEPKREGRREETGEENADSPAGLSGFRGILIGKLVSKDVEKGTFVVSVDAVKRVWKANKAPAPEKSIGKDISVAGISGKFLDTLLVLEIGTRIEVEAFQVRGKTLKFPGEWLKKAE